MMSRVNRLTPTVVFLLACVFVVIGCDSNGSANEPDPEIAEFAISPDSVSIAVGEQVDFAVIALTASGDTVQDADLDVEWWSTDSTVFTVENDGQATGQNSGRAFCMAEVSDGTASTSANLRAAKRFVGRDSALVVIF